MFRPVFLGVVVFCVSQASHIPSLSASPPCEEHVVSKLGANCIAVPTVGDVGASIVADAEFAPYAKDTVLEPAAAVTCNCGVVGDVFV